MSRFPNVQRFQFSEDVTDSYIDQNFVVVMMQFEEFQDDVVTFQSGVFIKMFTNSAGDCHSPFMLIDVLREG